MTYYIGVDLGGTNIVAGVVNDNYKIISKASRPTNPQREAKALVKDIVDSAKEALEKANLKESDVSYLGVGVPSTVNQVTKRVVFANNLGWKDYDFIKDVHEFWDIPVEIGNDADVAAVAEALAGVGKDYNNILFLTIGTGVGGGLILDKKLYGGGDGLGFEPGHTTIAMDGIPCTCGKKGCFESYASVTALNRQAKQAMEEDKDSLLWELCEGNPDNVNGEIIFKAANNGDSTANRVVDTFIHYLAVGTGSLIATIRPEVVIVGGGVSAAGERLFKPWQEELPQHVYGSDVIGVPKIIQASLGNDAGIIGAALLGK